MKIFAILCIIGLFGYFLISLDETTNWYGKLKYWIREKLGLCNHCKEIIL